MPDITMCHGYACALKKDCYRYTAKPSPYMQSYFVSRPYDEDEDGTHTCEKFWGNQECTLKTTKKT